MQVTITIIKINAPSPYDKKNRSKCASCGNAMLMLSGESERGCTGLVAMGVSECFYSRFMWTCRVVMARYSMR